jgi:hypothetical protein
VIGRLYCAGSARQAAIAFLRKPVYELSALAR